MELEEAMQVIAQVCAMHNGPLADHQRIQAALARVMEELPPSVSDPTANGAREVSAT